MKRLLLAAIAGYWRLVPPERRRTCLFARSCSRRVFDVTAGDGLFAGITALWQRYRSCRPGYALLNTRDDDGGLLLRLSNGHVVRLDVMAEAVRTNLGEQLK